MAHRTRLAPTLSHAIYAFVILGAIIGAVFLIIALRETVDEITERAMAEAVEVRSEGILSALRGELDEEWQNIEALAEIAASGDMSQVRISAGVMASSGSKVNWVGFAAVDGTVLAASNGMLEGADVSTRPWFMRGLQGAFAGDVHDAVLLANLLGPNEIGEPPRFIDYALPVTAPDGRILGVVGMHIDFDWAASYVTELARTLQLDALLVSEDGTIIVSTLDLNPARPTVQPFRLAAVGMSASVLEQWPDGREYYSVVIPIAASAQTPNFGWRLIARIDSTAFATIDSGLPQLLLPTTLTLLCLLVIASVVFVRLFAHPFQRAAASAERIGDGGEDVPFESFRTRELAQISAALAVIQSKLRPPS